MQKKLICIGLSIWMAFETVLPVWAVTSAGVRQQQEQTQKNLAGLETEIDKMETEMHEAGQELIKLQNNLVDLITSIEICEEEIDAKKLAIDDARDEMMVVKQKEEQQYVDMKKRVKFLYEQGDKAYIQILFSSANYSQMVNKADYVEKILAYDRKLLADYVASKEEVAKLKTKLEEEEVDLEAASYELAQEQDALEVLVAEKRETVENFDEQLDIAQAKAEEYKEMLIAQTDQIKQLEVQEAQQRQQQAILAARRAAAAAARRRQQASRPKKPVVDENAEAVLSADANDSADPENQETSADYSYAETDDTGYDDSSYDDYYDDYNYSLPDYSAGVGISFDLNSKDKGEQVVAYAAQFLGCPYKFGGTSLTTGIDCSSFTQQIFANFDVNLPRDSTSQRSCGEAIAYEDAKPGDLICYAGHVAIYAGKGQIIHASSERTGVTFGYATYRTILAVRRVL